MAMETSFRDAMPRARWLRRLLWWMLACHAAALAADVFERSVLLRAQTMDAGSMDAVRAAATWSDRLQLATAIALVLAWLVGYVAGGLWIVRVARNVLALGATGLDISPGWAVGWYAIPVGNLFKPFHAMQDIWRASVDAMHWRQVATPEWLRLWWGCWLGSNILSQASLQLTIRAKHIDDLLLANAVSVADEVAGIALCLMFALVVARVTATQNRQWLAAPFPVPDAMSPNADPPGPTSLTVLES
jgi:hypothetical protein